MKKLTLIEWREQGEALYGTNIKDWKFQCPSCKQIQTAKEFEEANIENPQDKFFFSCIGRWVENRGCKWTLGGFLPIHKTEVTNEEGKEIPVFEFADEVIVKHNDL